ncbi:MAG: hypothetical protein LBT80_08090 [Lactobacillaceae bacterium]|jgi:hypothetical protein|nr:hypothetical protein [Lactobacillaceae bacterium]
MKQITVKNKWLIGVLSGTFALALIGGFGQVSADATAANNYGLTVINTQRAQPSATVQADDGLLYTVNAGEASGDVTVTNLVTKKVVKHISLGNDLAKGKIIAPDACVTDGKYVYAIGGYYRSVFTIDTATQKVVAQVDSPEGAESDASSYINATIDKQHHLIYIGREDEGIDVYNTATKKYEKTISVVKAIAGQSTFKDAIVQQVFYDDGVVYFGGEAHTKGMNGGAGAFVGEYNVTTKKVQGYWFPGEDGSPFPAQILQQTNGVQGLDVVHFGQKKFLYETSHVRQGELNVFDLTTKKVVATYNLYSKTLKGRPHSVVTLPNNKVGVGVSGNDGSHLSIIDLTQNTNTGGKLVKDYLVVPGMDYNNKVNLYTANQGKTLISPDRTAADGKLWIYNNPSN